MDPSQLTVSVEEQARWRRVLSVTVPASVVQAEEQQAARKLASRARMKGFRKGRVPARLIEGRYGGALRQEALDKLIQNAFREALASQELRPISEGEIEDLQYQPEQDLTFRIAFDVEPVVRLERLGGFVVERPVPAVGDEHVTSVLGRIQEQNGVWRPIEEGVPQEGDLVSVKIRKIGDDEEHEPRDYDFVLGQGDALPDVERAIESLEVGGEGEFDVTFPDDFPDESRRGEVERVHVTLAGRRVLEVPELDDELAKQVGDFETLDDLRAKVREDMEKEATDQAENAVRTRLLDALIEANPFEVPESMVTRYAEGVIGSARMTAEQRADLVERIRPDAERAVKRILVVDQVAETQGLAATEDDVDARVEEIAGANDAAVAKVYAELQKAGRLEAIERDLTENNVFNFLKEQSEIIDAPAG